jgi:putative transposase
MPEYRRATVDGGTFFLTVATHFRRPLLVTETVRRLLRQAIIATQRDRPFTLDAVIVPPDHWHCIWTLPPGDTDFSTRMRLLKGRFTRAFLAGGGTEAGRSASRQRKAERSVWQRRFWEHTVRDERAFERVCDYIHYNAVKHGYVACPHAWPYSSFHRFVREGRYDGPWMCECGGRKPAAPELDDIGQVAGE